MLTILLACAANDDTANLDTSAPIEEEVYEPGSETDGGYEGPLSFDGDRPYNVLMISIDTFRVGELGWFGGQASTPEIDALLDESVVFTDHRSCSNWTFSSVLCFQGGAEATDLSFVPEAAEGHDQDLGSAPDSITLAPEVLSAAGWGNHLITTNAFFDTSYGTAQGFDDIENLNTRGAEADADTVVDAALETLGTVSDDEPWYVHAHFMDPHQGYGAPDEYLVGVDALEDIDWNLTQARALEELAAAWDTLDADEQALVKAHLDLYYRAELAYVSDGVGRLLDEARAAGQLDHTLVVIWSDHGEELAEHGEIGHHVNLYDASNRALAALWAPNLEPMAWTGRTTHAKVWPTVLDVLPHAFATDLPGATLGEGDATLRFGQKLTGSSSSAFVEDGEHKLLVWSSGDAELYDLAADPEELTNLVGDEPAVASELWTELAGTIADLEELADVSWADPGL